MSTLQRWNPTDLAKCAGVSVNQIYAWFHQGELKGEIDQRGVLRLPLTESVAAFALRDGKDPEEARRELMHGRDLFRAPDTAPYRTKEQTQDSLYTFIHKTGLPAPNNGEPVDPRKEKE